MSDSTFKDEILLRREAEKLYRKQQKVEDLESKFKNELRRVLSDPNTKKALGMEVAKVVKATESGDIDPILRKFLNSGNTNIWGK